MSDAKDCLNARRSETLYSNRGENILDYIILSCEGKGQNLDSLLSSTLSKEDLNLAMQVAIERIKNGDFELFDLIQKAKTSLNGHGYILEQAINNALLQHNPNFGNNVAFERVLDQAEA